MSQSQPLTLRTLEVFMAVVETGSMVGAAGRLKTSPSAISQQITNLEASLEATLFDRNLRPIGLTPAGVLLQRHAVGILSAVEAARAELVNRQLSSLPELRLAIIDDLDASVTPRLAMALAADHPDCNLVVWSGRSDAHCRALVEREVDVIVTADPLEDVAGLERHSLLSEPLILVARRGVLAPRGGAKAEGLAAFQARIGQRPFVRYSARTPLGRDIERHLRRVKLAPPHRFEFDSTHSVFAVVRDSDGWAITTPLCYLDCLAVGAELEACPLPFAGTTRNVSLVARAGELGSLPENLANVTRSLFHGQVLPLLERRLPWVLPQVQADPPGPARGEGVS